MRVTAETTGSNVAVDCPSLAFPVGGLHHDPRSGGGGVSYANGATEPFADVSDVAGGSLARSSAAKLAADPEGDLLALRARVSAAMASLLEATAGRHSNDPVM